MKFGQLIEYNMRNIFLKESYTKCVGETRSQIFPDPVLKNEIEHISGSVVLSFTQFVFTVH